MNESRGRKSKQEATYFELTQQLKLRANGAEKLLLHPKYNDFRDKKTFKAKVYMV